LQAAGVANGDHELRTRRCVEGAKSAACRPSSEGPFPVLDALERIIREFNNASDHTGENGGREIHRTKARKKAGENTPHKHQSRCEKTESARPILLEGLELGVIKQGVIKPHRNRIIANSRSKTTQSL
jgi:hypothetical protein